MRTSLRLLALAGFALGFSSLCLSHIVADDPVSNEAEREPGIQIKALEQLLKCEAAGKSVDRRSIVQLQPQSDWAAWQAGLVKTDQGWLAPDRLSDVHSDSAYNKKRDEAGNDIESHVKLARWCRENHRENLARAHYFAVLAENPDHEESRKFFGHIQVGGEWIDANELKAKQQAVRKDVAAFERTAAKLQKILEDLASSNTSTLASALDRLDALDGQSALPAIALAAMRVDDDLAQPLVRKIAQVKSPDACLALVRLACFHPSTSIRQLALKNLKTYRLEMYVPTLLSQLAGDVTVENQMIMRPNGHVSLETIVKQELQDKHVRLSVQKSVSALSTFFTRRDSSQLSVTPTEVYMWSIAHNIPKDNPRHLGTQLEGQGASATAIGKAAYVPTEVAQSVADNLKEQGQAKKLEAEQFNRAQVEKAAPIYSLLREVTGQDLEDDPTLWWRWWTEANERYEGLKPVQMAYSYSREKLPLDSRVYKNDVQVNDVAYRDKRLVRISCLVAGTTVQTSTGLRAIESIKIGDRVLCQDTESGEIALQPVLLTTVRPPKDTVKIVTDGATIQATGGHLWWVSGKGWQKTRDLKPDDYLHSVSGNVRIKQLIAVEEPVQTFNLVVDRHHTYFVGPDRILSYDNTPLKPTLLTLPGYTVH